MLNSLLDKNDDLFERFTIEYIFKVNLELQEDDHRKALLISRKKKQKNTVVTLRGHKTADIETAFEYINAIQISARNIQNFKLLKMKKPILKQK